MFEQVPVPYRYLLFVLVFPIFFQEAAIIWAWGPNDALWIAVLKRIFLLLPICLGIASCWLTIVCAISVIVRQKRRQFVSSLFITWWDFGRATFSFWGGSIKFAFMLIGAVFTLLRVCILGIWLSIQDIVLVPVRTARGVSNLALQAGTPWIAVIMTLVWCALEALIFTYIMSGLVVETLSNITGKNLDLDVVQFFLYFMLLAFVVGSYAIVATLESAFKSRDIKQIMLVLIVEFVALVFEVLFLYREFVDALTPWFAQHAGGDFKLGMFTIIGIAALVWAGIRGMTWFLFAAHGTPTIMAIIQRTGLGGKNSNSYSSSSNKEHFLFIREAIERIQKDMDWVHEKGDELLSAFIMPPLQIVAAVVNFATLLISGKHLFELPFKSFRDLMHATELIRKVKDD